MINEEQKSVMELFDELIDDDFRKECPVFLDVMRKIEGYLKCMGLLYALALLNMNSMNIKLPSGWKRLHTIIVVPKGCGKSTFLKAMVNKKYMTYWSSKVFESELVKMEKESFNRKVQVHDDLIVAFNGLSTKQRHQLTGFIMSMASEKKYSRQAGNKITYSVEGDVCFMFGMALENWDIYKQELFDSTMLDRFSIIYYEVSDNEILEILEHLDYLHDNKIEIPDIEFKIARTQTEINLKKLKDANKDFKDERKQYAFMMQKENIMSFARALQVIDTILMSSAYMNNRKEVCLSDFKIVKLMFNLMVRAKKIIVPPIKRYKEMKEKYPELTDREIAEKMEVSYDALRQLKKYYSLVKPKVNKQELVEQKENI